MEFYVWQNLPHLVGPGPYRCLLVLSKLFGYMKVFACLKNSDRPGTANRGEQKHYDSYFLITVSVRRIETTELRVLEILPSFLFFYRLIFTCLLLRFFYSIL